MNIFLTGEIQVGKSTLIRRVIAEMPGVQWAGFRTVTVADVPGAIGSVYLVPAVREAAYSMENRVGTRYGPGRGMTAFPAVFDQVGQKLLEEAGQFLLMDEIGRMEAEAEMFRARVLSLLDGDIPILGVVQKRGETALQEEIRRHPNVRLLEVTAENREELFPAVLEMARRERNRRVDSAGAFVFRRSSGGIEVLMIQGRKGWAFPKGHIEYGETAEAAAIREVQEETGIEIALFSDFRYSVPSGLPGEHRSVTYFLGSYFGGRLAPQLSEIRDATWVPAEQAAALLRFPEDVPAFDAALGAFLSINNKKIPKT